MTVIGITGPTGAGKTTALGVLERMGAGVIDADALYHGLLDSCCELREALAGEFGRGILDSRGKVDRRALAGAVYPGGLDRLNAITHPFVAAAVDQLLEEWRAQGRAAAAIDAIALVESGLDRRCDAVVAVTAPLEDRIQRIMARDGIDEGYARRRALAQRDESFFRAHAGYVLENSGDPAAFARQAEELFRALLAEDRKGTAPDAPE